MIFYIMDGIVGLVMFVTVVFLICSLCGWCCQRKQKGVVFSRPGDNITNPYDPNYGQTNPYPTQSIVPPSQHAPVLQQAPAGMPPYQPTSYPAGAGPYTSYTPSTNTAPPYPTVGPAGSDPYPSYTHTLTNTAPPYPMVGPAGSAPVIPPSSNAPYPPAPTYPTAVPVGTAPKLPTYQEATGDATSGSTSVTNELYTKQAPYNPNYN